MFLRLGLPAIVASLAAAPMAGAQTVTLRGPGHPPATVDEQQLQTLPQADAVRTSGNPGAEHHFRGPLLWTVLSNAHLVDPAHHGDVVRQTVLIQGSDKYTAILAMGELSPEFEDKAAILALTMDGKPLSQPRAVIPTDHRAGRSVHDVVSITVEELPKP